MSAPPVAADQLLTFRLGAEDYGIPILQVREIRGFGATTPVPNTPEWLRGVMNLRGAVVPVIDLRRRLGLPPADDDRFTVTIVVDSGDRLAGLVVDAVSDVLDVGERDSEPIPHLSAAVDGRFLSAVARAGERLVLVLDVPAVVGRDPSPDAGTA